MKIILTLITALTISTTASAQITSGSHIVGGGIGFRYSQTPNGDAVRKSTRFRIELRLVSLQA